VRKAKKKEIGQSDSFTMGPKDLGFHHNRYREGSKKRAKRKQQKNVWVEKRSQKGPIGVKEKFKKGRGSFQ